MRQLDELLAYCTNVEQLAQGGQKVVVAATHPKYGDVVIKNGDYGITSGLERIVREVELLKEIDSPYYPKQFEFLIDANAKQFLIVEQRLHAPELSAHPELFSTDEAILALLQHLVAALSIIWEKNVVHRDIKPGNILVDSERLPKIIDLGIARFLDQATLTASHAPHGPATPIYAAPEQLTNRKSMISVRTDFFLLGIVILELMHGFHPYAPTYVGNERSIVENIQLGHYVPPSAHHDDRLRGFVTRSLQPKPFDRPRTVNQVMAQLGMEMKT